MHGLAICSGTCMRVSLLLLTRCACPYSYALSVNATKTGANGDIKGAMNLFFEDHPAMKIKLAQLPPELLVTYLDGECM